MGDILPFISRLLGRLDWSPGEKARLQQLADSLGQGELDLEVVFGRSDQGDPWCAVTGQDQEVLVHIARIGDRFIVHHIAEDVLETGSSLWAAVERALGEAWADLPAPSLAEVVPIEAQSRHTHILSALIVAAVLIEAEQPSPGGSAEPPPAAPLPPEAPAEEAAAAIGVDGEALSVPGRVGIEAPMKVHSGAGKLDPAALYEADPSTPMSAPHASTPGDAPPDRADPPAEAVTVTAPLPEPESPSLLRRAGGEGDDELVGTRAAEALFGGGGDDTLSGGGAPQGEFDWLDGGAGDDRLTVDAQVVAVGGDGADRFVFVSPPKDDPGPMLGRVLDFSPGQGDALATQSGPAVVVTARPEADILEGAAPPAGFGPTGALPGFRVGMDLDGDGEADGEVLLAGPEVAGFLADSLRGADPAEASSTPEPPPRLPEEPDGAFLI